MLMKNHTITALCLLASLLAPLVEAMAVEPTQSDIEYATVDGHHLRLDLYRPPTKQACPVIVWIHGGAWRAGSKNSVPIRNLVEHGFAIASVDYRLSPVARFPAQAHDIKAAIRFLRANAAEYKLGTRKIVIAGASAGGHLAALVGVTNGVSELEGGVGQHLGESSAVQGIVSFYGASNLQTILSQSTPHGLSVRIPALDLFLGGQPEAEPERARLASPVVHVDETDPPLLLIHGDQDPQMPINQSHELHARYKSFGLPVQFEVVHGAAHGGKGFYEAEMLNRVAEYLSSGTLRFPRPVDESLRAM